jgi:hypothetical protein
VLTNLGTTPVNFTSLTVSDAGTGNPSGISGISLLNNGSPVAGPVGFAGTSATFSALSVNVPASGSVTLQVIANFSNVATAGTYQFSVTAGVGTNGQPVNFTGLPSTGATITIAFATATFTNTPTSTNTSTATVTSSPTVVIVAASQGAGAPANSTQLPGTNNVPVQQIVLANPSNVLGVMTGLTLSVAGTGNPSAITGVTLFKNGISIASATFSGSTAAFSFSDTLPASSSVTYTMTANFNAGASGNYQFSITGATGSYGSAIGPAYPFSFSGIPVTGATVHIAFATATFTNTPTSSWTPTPSATPINNKPDLPEPLGWNPTGNGSGGLGPGDGHGSAAGFHSGLPVGPGHHGYQPFIQCHGIYPHVDQSQDMEDPNPRFGQMGKPLG